ncbi:hypothetical protein AB6A40_000903 [Gnathostoma spinigerum]|uniref:Uncharacterized protein n=1 Tax=Gnathostoma spinigerum TaxID=75299 RepID=A0ABD6EA05_9BILA
MFHYSIEARLYALLGFKRIMKREIVMGTTVEAYIDTDQGTKFPVRLARPALKCLCGAIFGGFGTLNDEYNIW